MEDKANDQEAAAIEEKMDELATLEKELGLASLSDEIREMDLVGGVDVGGGDAGENLDADMAEIEEQLRALNSGDGDVAEIDSLLESM